MARARRLKPCRLQSLIADSRGNAIDRVRLSACPRLISSNCVNGSSYRSDPLERVRFTASPRLSTNMAPTTKALRESMPPTSAIIQRLQVPLVTTALDGV